MRYRASSFVLQWKRVHLEITELNKREDRKGLIMIKHPITKNSAKEESQNSINYCSKMHESNEGEQKNLHIYIYGHQTRSLNPAPTARAG